MIYSIRIDGVQRPPVTVEELGALIDRKEFKPSDSLIGPGLSQWATGAEASAHLRQIFRGRLPPEFGTFTPPPRRIDPSAKPPQSGWVLLGKILVALFAISVLLGLALFLLLYGLCGGFR
jgi:hypothetical protein